MALPVTNTPPSVWYEAEVVNVAQAPGQQRWVAMYRVLIGPVGGATSLAAGDYDWTVKLTDNPGPEVPIRKAGVVKVTAV